MKTFDSFFQKFYQNYIWRQLFIFRVIILTILFFLIIGLYYHVGANENIRSENSLVIPDSLHKNNPDVNVKVNKEYDENGTIIRYDSSYSWSYSSANPGNMDSLINNFNMPFSLNNFFFNQEYDSAFFSMPESFGFKSIERQMEQMQKMLEQLNNLYVNPPPVNSGKTKPGIKI